MRVVYIFIYAALMTLSVEILVRQGSGLGRWLRDRLVLFLLNTLIYAGVLTVTLGFTKYFLWAGMINAALFYTLASVSFFKYAARNEVLYASDFLLFFKVMSVSDKSNIHITRYNIGALLLMVCGLIPAFWMPPIGFGAARIPALAGVGVVLTLPALLYAAHGKKDDFTYFIKGFAAGLLCNVYLYVTEKRAEPAQPGAINISVYEPDPAPPVQPNVIMVLSESFWNIEKIPGLRFSEKVTPHFNTLAETCTHGNLLVTPFGGGTCNVESEILTGAPVRYFNLSNSFYHRYITHPILALPRIFRQNGYETTALHTFDKNFYNRDKALAFMGFEHYKAKEDLTDPCYEGTYIADSELTRMIIQSFENKSKPAFILGISMENHQPYTKNKYQHNPIKIVNKKISPALKDTAEAYAHGLHDADRELAALIRYFEQVKEPTDIIFFGDHLGALGPLFALYKEMGFISTGNTRNVQDIRNLYATDFIIWSNYQSRRNIFSDTSANFLGNIVLNHIGIQKPDFYYFLDEVYAQWHTVNRPDLFIDAGGRYYTQAPEALQKTDAQYRHLARKLILG